MKIGERLLLIFMTLVFVALAIGLGACIWSASVLSVVVRLVETSIYVKIISTAVLAIILVLSFRSMLVSTGEPKTNAALAATTDEGAIYINLDTISSLAAKAVKCVDGVRELRVKTVMCDEGANILVKVSLFPEIVIPEASQSIQQSVKNDVQLLCGIAVKKVVVQVDNSLQAQK